MDLDGATFRDLLDAILLRWVVVVLAAALAALRIGALLRRRTGVADGRRVIQEDADHRATARNFWDPEHGLYGKPDLSLEEDVPGVGVRMVATELKPLQRRRRLLPSDAGQAVVYGLLHQAEYGDRAADFARVRYAEETFTVPLAGRWFRDVLAAARAIRGIRRGAPASRNHTVRAKCAGCAVRDSCSERLDL